MSILVWFAGIMSVLLRVREDIDPSEEKFIEKIAIEFLLIVRLSARSWRKNSEQSKQYFIFTECTSKGFIKYKLCAYNI